LADDGGWCKRGVNSKVFGLICHGKN
jgi:hypothetical protein